jgi:ribonuclease P protein component
MSDHKDTRLLRLVDELAEAAKRVGLEVRRERILREIGYRARGGACRLRETDMIIIDRDQPAAEQIEVIAEALRNRDLEAVYLSPAARRVLQTGTE